MSLPVVLGAVLPPLGWQHCAPFNLANVLPISGGEFTSKPRGGLWTSPLREGGVTGWTEWRTSENFANPADPITLVIPDSAARVYVVDAVDDLIALESAHPDTNANPVLRDITIWPQIDWAGVASEVDAIWLTDQGQWRTRHSIPCLYGWDCETVFWLNPRFTVGERIEMETKL